MIGTERTDAGDGSRSSSTTTSTTDREAVSNTNIKMTATTGTSTTIEKHSSTTEHAYDISRTSRWTTCGFFLHGPYFLMGFSWLDQRFPNPAQQKTMLGSLKVVATKTMTAQIVLFPPYLVLLFGAMGLLEHHPDLTEKIRTHVPQAFVTGSLYWPVVNSINFALVPPSGRVPYLAVCAGVWNSYLSWSNQR
jgi:hypothetical protein